jgi:serine/threonine-protein kinase PknG
MKLQSLVEVPSISARDPGDALMVEPTVPETRRFCTTCTEPVGRGREGTPGRATGFCRNCGNGFSFTPKLSPGQLVAGQYEVAGCLAHGGMGWVYLARDHNVSDRWVVLKGLLNADDHDATTAAMAERRFLAEVEHPNIVKIFNFVEHDGAGYIVMEYVGGRSLKQILAARESGYGEPNPLPPDQAIAYVLEILPALAHLHEIGLLFCDFKVDNVIQTRHSLKLIDLGSVYRVDEPGGGWFGTPGYEAPEVPEVGPSIASDLYTVARTLAVLCIGIPQFRYSLPTPDAVALFARYDSLYRFLLKGTAPDPDDRFRSADEMADQLRGVLAEVVADRSGTPAPTRSTLFTSAPRCGLELPDRRHLPRPLRSGDERRALEIELRLMDAMLDDGRFDEADALLAETHTTHPREWRVDWYRALADLGASRTEQARTALDAVYGAVPGELGPKLALGVACELGGELVEAARWYEVVARTDPAVTAASFGLARCLLATGDRTGALAAYERVPDSSSGYIDAQTARVHVLSAGNGNGQPAVADLLAAGAALESLPVEEVQRERLTAELLEAALRLTLPGANGGDGTSRLLGVRLEEHELRLGLERCYRELARHAPTRAERIALVDDANRIRPRTWV